METDTTRVRSLNDQLRKTFTGGTAILTSGVAALGVDAIDLIFKTIAIYDELAKDELDQRSGRSLLGGRG